MIELIKPLQTIVLTLSGVSACLSNKCSKLLPLTAALLLDIAGTTLVNMYLDRDIDMKMERTKSRASARSERVAKASLVIGLILVTSSFLAASMVSVYVLLAAILGFIIDIVAYTLLLKRKRWWSVVIGGLAGGMPAFGGWLAGGGSLTKAFLLLLSIDAWSCAHIWALASHYRDDYARAEIPMLPVVNPNSKHMASIAIILATILANMVKWMPLLFILSLIYIAFIFKDKFIAAFRVASLWIIALIILLPL